MEDELIRRLLENKTVEEIHELFINLHRRILNRKVHIKKYNKLRKLHGEILDSMIAYMADEKYNADEALNSLAKDLPKGEKLPEVYLDSDNPDDLSILLELFIYKNYDKLTSITEVYLKKNKFRNKEKVDFLNAMNNSYASLFEIVDADIDNGYVYYEDVFTHKKYKIIDISMSSTFRPIKNKPTYTYNRIITIDGISFATGIHCMLTWKNKKLKEFIKKHKYNESNGFYRCLQLYKISKEEKNLKTRHHHQYGYRF